MALQQEADKWEDENNAIIRVAKTMATQMYEMSRYARRTANSEVSLLSHQCDISVLKGSISDPKFQSSLFPEPPDFLAYSERTSLS